MKFAKELEQEAVPEWRVKYLNYKAGKKAIKAVSRAISRATTTPTLGRRTADPLPQHTTPASLFTGGPRYTHARSANGSPPAAVPENDPLQVSPRSVRRTPVPATHALTRAATVGNERSGLARSPESGMRYGAFAPPAPSSPSYASDRVDFELPAPAIRVPSRTSDNAAAHSPSLSRMALQRSASMTAAMPAGPRSPSTLNLPPGGVPVTPRMTPRLRLYRIFSSNSQLSRRNSSKLDIGMQNLDQVRSTERDFFHFLDGELDKIETFYKQKEDQASERLIVLREQLHEMRNRRTEEIAEAKRKREMERNSSPSDDDTGEGAKSGTHDWISPIKAKFLKPGPNTKALLKMNRTPVMTGQTGEARRDYVRRPHSDDVPYRTAKRKLKLALQEFYRGLELLKSYALLNRTAFRKLNKKYDKAINARPPYRYMNEKVNKSWFVNSDILDGHIRTVEDLYARYFERGNRKIAAGKLRNLSKRRGNSSGSAFRSGLLIGIGCVFAVQGLIYGSELLLDNESGLSDHTSYLMQLYGGYFLMLLLFIFFTLACRIWTRNKINYPFIFEFDPRNNLDWTQLAEFPSFFFALFGVFIWLNFSRFGNTWETMYLYYPVILIGLSLAILFFPAPIIHYKARRWFVYSHVSFPGLFWHSFALPTNMQTFSTAYSLLVYIQ
ncbi:SPX domain-containing protein [Lasiosphaeria ovina]|uniref:SPX domain-containing protein n=1 Tax=Lasiosphaeria ovina TaxID=92902 RepID=A0AAE0KBM2_9PEZI|nr:SPX domain-containing protein [Lasiosphaeria ovina]